VVAVPSPLSVGVDGLERCWWCGTDADYLAYHDDEWGRPTSDDRRLFETLCLEGFQAGLSWLTILRKRERFREVFSGFAIDEVARYTGDDVERLLGDAGIVRHRGKVTSTIANARRAVGLIAECGSLAAYVWRYEPAAAAVGSGPDLPASVSAEATAMSRDLKRRGWTFVGPTTVYAFMQSVGVVNDHVAGCWRRDPTEADRRAFRRPA
jgi:DNA-3-methyladenine glycosylase I